MLRRTAVLCFLASVVFASKASAGFIVYDQPQALGPQDSDLAGYDSYENAQDNIVAFENFVLNVDYVITDLHWYGFYGNIDPPINPVSSFDIGFYADDNGAPGALLSAQTVGPTTFMEMAVADPAGLPNQFQYWIDFLPNSFPAANNTTYYVSIQANLDGDQPWGLRAGQGDGLLWQEDAAGLFQLAGNNNFAFSLTAGVPEPSTFAVWSLLGLAACGTFSLAQAFGKRRMYDKSRFGKDVVPSRVS